MPISAISKTELTKAAGWIATTVVGALVGILLKAWWDAPRPTVELVSVELASPAQDREFAVPAQLLSLAKAHLYIEDLPDTISAGKLDDVLRKAARRDEEFIGLSKKIGDLVVLLKTRSGTPDERRKEFLVKWADDGTGELLSRRVKSTLSKREQALPEHYKRHPVGTEKLEIALTDTRTMVLGQIDEEATARGEAQVQGPVNVYQRVLRDAKLTNLLRRTWLYLEPSVLIPLLEETQQSLDPSVEESRSIATKLRLFIESNNPKHLVARVIVTNRGRDSLPIRNLASLQLIVPPREANSPPSIESVKLVPAKDSDLVAIVRGGEALSLSFISELPVAELARSRPALTSSGPSGDFRNTRLAQLFEGGGLSASVRLARAGVPNEQAPLPPAPSKPIGPQSSEALIQLLSSAK